MHGAGGKVMVNNRPCSEETKRKISLANKGRVIPEATRQKMQKPKGYGKELNDVPRPRKKRVLIGNENFFKKFKLHMIELRENEKKREMVRG
jgi:hypothetical protein